MAANRPRWQLCKWCRGIRERPCISDNEAFPCEFGKRDRIRRDEENAKLLEKMIEAGDYK
jgi:hypothetical protein